VRQAETQKASADSAVTARLPEAYQWLLVPVQDNPQAAVAWQAFRLSGQDALAVRTSKKLKNDELLVPALAGTRLKMDLDRVPLWRGEHVPVRQLAEDFARYLYLPRLVNSAVLRRAIEDGLVLLTWSDSFAYADTYDEATGRYRGLRGGQHVAIADADTGLLVRPDVARKQLEVEASPAPATSPTFSPDQETGPLATPMDTGPTNVSEGPDTPDPTPKPRRFYGSVTLDSTRVGRDASRIADEVIAHLVGLMGSTVRVTLEIAADIPSGAPDHVVRTVTENSRTLKFNSQGFEAE